MVLPLTSREIKIVLQWRSQVEDWPDERRVLSKLWVALDNERFPELSSLQIQIIREWAEEEMGGHFGGGLVTNIEGKTIFDIF